MQKCKMYISEKKVVDKEPALVAEYIAICEKVSVFFLLKRGIHVGGCK